MAYNPSSWDTLNINDDSFLAMLQKQIAAANPASLVLDPTRFPAPPADNPTPPLSAESSPSPPNYRDQERFLRSSHFDIDEHNKRKVQDFDDSDDEISGQPQQKSQRDSAGNKKGSARRKSTGANADESRLLKRKEQNRAAQRAFRERKERHVKELEDQVAALENKTQSQNRENENLKDLLKRLQNENIILKQSAFTFRFPPGGEPSAEGGAAPQQLAQASGSGSPKLASPPSSSSASTPDGAESAVYSSLFAGPSTSAGSSASSTSSPRSEANTSQFHHSPSDFGFGSAVPDFSNVDFSNNSIPDTNGSRKPHYTTIASNPMYTSYQDPVLDPMAWASFGPGDYTQSDMDMNMFGVVDKPDYVAPAFMHAGSTGSAASLQDLFGQNSFVDYDASFSGSTATFPSPSALGMISMEPSPSPVLHRSAVGDAKTLIDHGDGCPRSKEQAQEIISKGVPSTFGPPVMTPPAIQRRESDEKDAAAHARMAALCADLPRTAKRPNQIEIGRAWEKVRQHPQFDDCDIDELCNELSAKAKCDGSRPVLEESSFNDIVHSLPGMIHKR